MENSTIKDNKVIEKEVFQSESQERIHKNVGKEDFLLNQIDEFRENFVQHVARYRDQFPDVRSGGFSLSTVSSARGFQDCHKQRNCVWVLASEFDQELLKHGLDASPSTLKELHNRGIIEHFGDRFKKIYRNGKISPTCYCFYPDSGTIAPPKTRKTKPKSPLHR